MISNLTLKQKIIVGIIIAIMIIVIATYGIISTKKEENMEFDINNMIEQNTANENLIEEQNEINVVEEKIIVHIIGEVKKTGILSLPKGARIADAIDAAGGIKDEADLNKVNLAYILEDGQKIYIPNKDEKEENIEYITSGSGNNVIIQNTNKGDKKVNINEASQNDLETLPGIGPSISSKIIEYREQNGKFKSIEDLQNVKGIGDSKFANIKEHITVK